MKTLHIIKEFLLTTFKTIKYPAITIMKIIDKVV